MEKGAVQLPPLNIGISPKVLIFLKGLILSTLVEALTSFAL